MHTIPIAHKGGTNRVLVDDEDYPAVKRYRWCLVHGYAARNARPEGGTTVYMHRQILGLERGDKHQVDHINRDKLDNRRENLRLTTHALNRHNLPSYRGSTSAYRGVSWSKPHKKWRATAMLGRKQHHIGLYDDEAMAGEAAAAFRAEHMSHAVD